MSSQSFLTKFSFGILLLIIVFIKFAESNDQCDVNNKLCLEPPDSEKRFFSPPKTNPLDADEINNKKVTRKIIKKKDVSVDTPDILVYTVATESTDGFQRYLQSAKEYGTQPKVLGMGQKWQGGNNIKLYSGGGWKINLLKDALSKETITDSTKILFTDGYDVMFLSNLNEIADAFDSMKANVLFGVEASCWPDKSLADKYPDVKVGKRFLNSGLYMGYAKDTLKLLNYKPIKDKDDDQLFFTEAYLDQKLRDELNIKLDHESQIFQNLYGAISEIELEPTSNKEYTDYIAKNILTQTHPLIVHGNGLSKINLNSFSNYLSHAWSPQEGCVHCKQDTFDLSGVSDNELSMVLLGLFIETPTPFLLEHLQKLDGLAYPKKRIHLFIHNNVKFHSQLVSDFVKEHSESYASIKYLSPTDEFTDWTARDRSLEQCRLKKCKYYFSVDSVAHLDNPHTLRLLIEQNRTFVAPMLVRPGKAWSNFWGALTTDGFYARSNDYMDIVHNEKRGLWNVPFVANCYLVKADALFKNGKSRISFSKNDLDSDMAFCSNIRDLDIFMYVSNRLDFGHLVNVDTFDTTLTAPEMYQIFENQKDWEARYIHPEFAESLNPHKKPLQPCPDVYWFPIVTPKFNTDLIHMMESFGKWSDGSNQDTRLEGGYEAVPTRDIHMNQVGWERHWLYFLQQYIRPLQEHVFIGYFHDPPKSLMNFVVRYRPDEQPFLRPHHDSSTYTINIALNERGVDYEGGGCKFIRYNCSVVDTKPGWLLMHPGRLTHYHEGLLVTNGTRYIMIAFIDP